MLSLTDIHKLLQDRNAEEVARRSGASASCVRGLQRTPDYEGTYSNVTLIREYLEAQMQEVLADDNR